MQQRKKNVYFVGKILNDKEAPDDNAKTFAFSKTERASLQKQLKGIPVQLEHEDSLKVGEIMNSWRDNNDNFWVYGMLSGSELKSTFAKHAIQKKGPNQKPYYGGLSLQHVHREWKDGRTEKAPIEVSLVTEPRRRNCDIVWVSNDNMSQKNMPPQIETKEERYIGTLHAASSQHNPVRSENKYNTMATPQQTTPATPAPATPATPAETAPAAAAVPATQTEATPEETAAPTGLALNEQVFSEMSQLYEKEKAQQEELAKLREQLKKHQAAEEEAKAKAQQEEAAKGRALISSMLEHMKDLLGSSQEVQTLEPQLMKLGQNNPSEMNQLLSVISKASKKYKTQQIELQQANNSLNEKTLELKFQKLIKQHGIVNTTTEVASGRKRAVPQASTSQAPSTIPVKAAATTPAPRNPYLRAAGVRQNRTTRKNNSMNKDLLNAFMSNKAGGARQSMARLHNSLQETMQQRSMFPGRY